jgi:hypothetical protein
LNRSVELNCGLFFAEEKIGSVFNCIVESILNSILSSEII